MQPTTYSFVVLAMLLAILFSRDRVRSAWWVFAFLQLFAATSVASLSALGDSSLSAPQVGVAILLVTAIVAVAPSDMPATRDVFMTHVVALAIIFYAVLISIFGPRLFAGTVDLIGIRPETQGGVPIATPLEPRAGNITQSAYLAGSFLTALATSLVFARRLPVSDFLNAMLWIGAIHVSLGIIDAAGLALHQGRVLNFLRNANFTMVDQTIGTVPRLSGSLPEASGYAGFAIPFAVFATEHWARTRNPAAGVVGMLLWIMTLASTSSAGIFGVAVYVFIAIPRFLLTRGNFAPKIVGVFVATLAILITIGVALAQPAVYAAARDFVLTLTFDKSDSSSAAERGAWASQGWTAFQASFGLGTGAGSFRSSSYLLAVLGSLGVVGSLLVLTYVLQIARTLFGRDADPMRRSAAWAALFTLVPASIVGSSPDPTFVFGLFAGFALRPDFSHRPLMTGRAMYAQSAESESI